ncbi:MAG: Lrp/AsnC family transcriptional regulator, partial [Lentisphaeria bacterium]|nr:Lrp/AsnC family transcriptional regulator [Lentisphaeria bacterium]
MLNPEFKKNLLRLLAENARRPLEDIAERLETTPEKVADAITELEEA